MGVAGPRRFYRLSCWRPSKASAFGIKKLAIRNSHKILTISTFYFELLIANLECEALVIFYLYVISEG